MSVEIQENILLAPYTIYKIGGPARFFVEVRNTEELNEGLSWAIEKGIQFFILGAGSNILISDRGFDGLVIHMIGGEVKVDGDRLTADAGVMMARAVIESAKAGLTGFEWGIGVPGTIGGSVRGNAGCFGGEMKDVVDKVLVLQLRRGHSERSEESRDPSVVPFSTEFPQDDRSVEIFELNNLECGFSYRDSVFKRHPEWVILSATLKLKKRDPKEIQARIAAITKERSAKQDIGTKSCGCIFKNVSWTRKDIDKKELPIKFPELGQFENQPNIPASYLIDQAGLKGRQVGQAQISPKHANFFVNEGGARAEEVAKLIEIAKDTVKNKYGILLEEEIQYIGF